MTVFGTVCVPDAAVAPGEDGVLDFIGVGFGPSNLALAVAGREIDPQRRGLFFERRTQFDWHPGLLFDGSRMQISFLKDLATLRNPSSPFSFLQYVKAGGRLEHFVNLSEFHPTRWEYRDYLRWVARMFTDQVRYGSAVRRITPAACDSEGRFGLFRVEVQDETSGAVSEYWTRNVVHAAGGSPRYPANAQPGPRVIHSADFLHRFPRHFPDRTPALRFGVIGDGQSAGEVLLYLLQQYPNAQVHLLIPGYALRPVDRSPFVNEAFFLSEMQAFHGSRDARRLLLRQELRNTNYGVLAPELIDQIYNLQYLDRVKGLQRLHTHRFARLVEIRTDDAPVGDPTDHVIAAVEDLCTGERTDLTLDGIVLATGYDRRLDPGIFADVLPFLHNDNSGAVRLSESYRVHTRPQLACGLYLQGYGESSHGIADTLLSLLPFRSKEIFEDICRHAPAKRPARRLSDVEYPPKRHLESDPEKLYAVLERCRFATLISAEGDEPVVTHVPLILDRTKGSRGVLFGHMDRGNPHVELLEGRKVLALFHGPNAYISPHVYETEQLPTWNSITVHVRGSIRLLSTREEVLRGLASICETDARPGAYRLDLNHRSIDKLLPYIVGFELQIEELIGRFKLSQDRNPADRRLAALELAQRSEEGERALIEQVLGPSDWQRCIHELFEAQVSRAPEAPAVITDGGELTYREVNARANQLAHCLRDLGVKPEAIVGLALERSPDMLVALLGILKAGAAFVPLDPEYPQDRIDYMLSDTAAAVVVTQARFRERFAQSPRVLCMDLDAPAIAGARTDNLRITLRQQNLAYCVYTSGSTGRPKGVAMPHRGLVNHLLHMRSALRHSASDRVLQFTAITADGSLQEIFTTWLAGAALVLPAEKAPSCRDFMSLLRRHRVSVVSIPTAYWHFWVGELTGTAEEWPQGVRLVILGGEKVIPEKFRQWRQLPYTSNVAWVQDYGPTETTVSCTAFEAAPTDGPEDLCIGRPNANMRIYILDPRGQPVPPGATGELYIAGPGLARGYLNRPDLTAQAFVPNPFGAPGSRLYRTGDLGRYRPDGNLQFLERRDDQVKIMGHRVELAEIEGALLRCEGVRQAVVLACAGSSDEPRLSAYVVADDFQEDRVRQQLSGLLPRAMLPATFIPMAALPSTAGGKVDRARLRALEATVNTPTPLEMASDLEREIARLWAEHTGRAPRSVEEDFFAAGGDSLRALRLLSSLAALTGVELKARDFFAERTVRGLARLLSPRSSRQAPDTNSLDSAPRDPPEETAIPPRGLPTLHRDGLQRRRASNAQQRLWFLDRLQPGTATYSVPLAYRITGAFSAERLDRCLTALVQRHEALRTGLVMSAEKELWQQVAPPMEVHSTHLQARDFAQALEQAHAQAALPFDLSNPPLLRSVCIAFEQEVLWLLVLHHSVCDAWSVAILWRELMALYAGAQDLPVPAFQYGDYAHWQREWLSGPEAEAQRVFWREHLAGELPPLRLGDRAVPDNLQSAAGAMEECRFDDPLSHAMRETALRHGTTEFVVLLSGFLATLHRFTGQDEIVVGVPVACRSTSDAEGIVGYFTNTLPLRATFEPRMRFAELLRQVSEALAAALTVQELPFDQIVDALGLTRQGSTNPIFQAMFVMQTTPLDGVLQLGPAQVQEVIVHSRTAKVDVTCTLRSNLGRFEGELEYSTDVLSGARARGFITALLHLLGACTRDSGTFVHELAMLSRAQGQEILRRANSGFAAWPDLAPVHAYFEAQSQVTPGAIAIESGGEAIRSADLNRRANRFARRLMSVGTGPETLIGICMDRSIGMAVALLATLKSGAGFVPLDPDFPAERLRTIAADARLNLIVTHPQYASRLQDMAQVLLIEEPTHLDGGDERADENPTVPISLSNVAYVYYTSGSTGMPKGVVLDHRGVMNRLGWLRRQYTLREGDRVVHKTPLIFDLAIWEIFGPLMAGATVLMADPRAESDVEHIGHLLSLPRTVFAYFVPSMLEAFLNFASQRSYPDLRWVPVTGEAVPSRLLEQFRRHFALPFHNIYGQTETSELALWDGCGFTGSALIPIGRSMGIYRVFILDAALNPVPPGVPGEIYVAGVGGLARGYQGLPGLTAEKFIPNPYAVIPGERLYRTGDLGRLTEDGTMEYVGRTDQQLKIRGCRIETAEIEAILSRHPRVQSCSVIVRNDASGSPQLLAYVVGSGVSAGELRTHAEKSLPRYMLPSACILMDELPLTPSGKLDRARLPAPQPCDFEARDAHEAPQSELEIALAAIWRQVLGVERVGRTSDFFALGGNSLKSIQVIARVKDEFGVDIRVRDFFGSPTLDGLATLVDEMLLVYVTSLSDSEVERQLDQVRA